MMKIEATRKEIEQTPDEDALNIDIVVGELSEFYNSTPKVTDTLVHAKLNDFLA